MSLLDSVERTLKKATEAVRKVLTNDPLMTQVSGTTDDEGQSTSIVEKFFVTISTDVGGASGGPPSTDAQAAPPSQPPDELTRTELFDYYVKMEELISDELEDVPVQVEPTKFRHPNFDSLKPVQYPDDGIDDEIDEFIKLLQPASDDSKAKKMAAPPKKVSYIWNKSYIEEEGITDTFYPTNSSRRGLALLFVYPDLAPTRRRTFLYNQADDLEQLLDRRLEFKVERLNNPTKEVVFDTLNKLKYRSDVDGDCLLVAILSRGYKDGDGREYLYLAKDVAVETKHIWTQVDGSCCTVLDKKPKIFLQLGWLHEKEKSAGLETDSAGNHKKLMIEHSEPVLSRVPNMAHFFIVSAIAQEMGSPEAEQGMVFAFLNHFVKVMTNYGGSWDLARAMTMVLYEVSSEWKRVPSITSSLSKKFLFELKKTDDKADGPTAAVATVTGTGGPSVEDRSKHVSPVLP